MHFVFSTGIEAMLTGVNLTPGVIQCGFVIRSHVAHCNFRPNPNSFVKKNGDRPQAVRPVRALRFVVA